MTQARTPKRRNKEGREVRGAHGWKSLRESRLRQRLQPTLAACRHSNASPNMPHFVQKAPKPAGLF